jgi:hypothetical protein
MDDDGCDAFSWDGDGTSVPNALVRWYYERGFSVRKLASRWLVSEDLIRRKLLEANVRTDRRGLPIHRIPAVMRR